MKLVSKWTTLFIKKKEKFLKQAVLRIHECVTCIFRYTTEDISCFMLKRSQQLNLPYRVIRILKFLSKHCKFEFFLLVYCFSAWRNLFLCFPFNCAVCISCQHFLERMPNLCLLHVNASSVCTRSEHIYLRKE